MLTTQQSRNKPSPKDDDCGCNDCQDKDNATQVSINTQRAALCTLLYNSKGDVAKQEAKFLGEKELYKEKKCIFLNTEKSYRRYRNFEIAAGTELLQTNDSVKANTSQLSDWNKALNTTLTNLAKQMKDLKTKFIDLKDAACKLDTSYKDKCNVSQKRAITGKGGDNCEDKPPIDACKDAGTEIEQLICIPKGLALDIDSIFQSSSDVIGIQIFSNIDSLDQLQKDLQTKSIAFEKLISDTMKTRKTEMDSLQTDLVSSVKTFTQAAIDRNTRRAWFEGYYDATKFLCCPPCSCVPVDDPASSDNYKSQTSGDCECPPRLKDCEKKICEICADVQNTYCCADGSNPPGLQKKAGNN